jgi:hypothetical protein
MLLLWGFTEQPKSRHSGDDLHSEIFLRGYLATHLIDPIAVSDIVS